MIAVQHNCDFYKLWQCSLQAVLFCFQRVYFWQASREHHGLASRRQVITIAQYSLSVYNSAFAHCERKRLCWSATFLVLERKNLLPFLFLQGLFAANEWEIRILFNLYLLPPPPSLPSPSFPFVTFPRPSLSSTWIGKSAKYLRALPYPVVAILSTYLRLRFLILFPFLGEDGKLTYFERQ